MAVEILPLGCLYRLTFPNGKCYIGITRNTADHRFATHVCFARAGKRLCAVHHAILKYGAESVAVETLSSASWQELVAMEQRAIVEYATKFPAGYNLTDGGEGTIGVVRSDETRAKISKAKKGRKLTPEQIEKLRAANTGRVKTAEERAKLSAAHKGKPKSPEHVAKMKMRAGRPMTKEAREHLSAYHKGRFFSDETKAKISAACAAKWQERKRASALILQKAPTGGFLLP